MHPNQQNPNPHIGHPLSQQVPPPPRAPQQQPSLPSTQQLLRSTIIAAIVALVTLITIILPSEYAIDPTGIGRLLGLTEMGEIKNQLAAEAEQENATNGNPAASNAAMLQQLEQINARLGKLEGLIYARSSTKTVQAQPTMQPVLPLLPQKTRPAISEQQAPAPQQVPQAPQWRDEISVELQPGQGTEIKMVMIKGATAQFNWTANGSVLNYDTHGDGGGNAISYKKGRGEPGENSTLTAAFSGNHGWFWRNRTKAPVTLTLRTRGNYKSIKRLK